MTSQSQPYINQLKASKEFFQRSTGVLEEADSEFRPEKHMMTAAQQVAHVAHTLDWFREGASRPEGFDFNFEKQAQELATVKSLSTARQMLETAYAKAIEFLGSHDPAEPLPPGPFMGGEPLACIVWGMVEHTAHHRGALTVYSRLLGKEPPMPYGG